MQSGYALNLGPIDGELRLWRCFFALEASQHHSKDGYRAYAIYKRIQITVFETDSVHVEQIHV